MHDDDKLRLTTLSIYLKYVEVFQKQAATVSGRKDLMEMAHTDARKLHMIVKGETTNGKQ